MWRHFLFFKYVASFSFFFKYVASFSFFQICGVIFFFSNMWRHFLFFYLLCRQFEGKRIQLCMQMTGGQNQLPLSLRYDIFISYYIQIYIYIIQNQLNELSCILGAVMFLISITGKIISYSNSKIQYEIYFSLINIFNEYRSIQYISDQMLLCKNVQYMMYYN